MLTPAFAVLDGIADQAASDFGLNISTAHHNERLERGDRYLNSIIEDNSAPVRVTFITAKSFEIPRAVDIARELRRSGKHVILGGPGLTLADCKLYQSLIEEGIPFNVGEGENTIPQIIQDVLSHQLRPAYWQRKFVDIRFAPLPRLPRKAEFKKMMTSFGAIDFSRGCPFMCSFCSVRMLLGSNTLPGRCRPVEKIVAYISEAHEQISSAMVSDDNLRMAFTYPESKKALISLNEEKKRKGRGLYLFGQADAREDIIKEIPDLAAMGYRHLFFGLETKDKLVLERLRKKQNNPELYQAIADECRRNDITVSTGRMVGFPPQTPESIHQETEEFLAVVDIINNFFVTALPGTDDYIDAVRKSELTTWDLNRYDSTHSVQVSHENMTQKQAVEVYRQAIFESSPVKEIFKKKLQPWDQKTKGRLYSRLLAELGGRVLPIINRSLYGRPFLPMMDGIPHFPLPWGRAKRPAGGFKGCIQDPDDLEYQSLRSNRLEKAKFLSEIAWSPHEELVTA